MKASTLRVCVALVHDFGMVVLVVYKCEEGVEKLFNRRQFAAYYSGLAT